MGSRGIGGQSIDALDRNNWRFLTTAGTEPSVDGAGTLAPGQPRNTQQGSARATSPACAVKADVPKGLSEGLASFPPRRALQTLLAVSRKGDGGGARGDWPSRDEDEEVRVGGALVIDVLGNADETSEAARAPLESVSERLGAVGG